MSNPRQHHTVSAWLLRRFTDDDGYLWWWTKDLEAGDVQRQKPDRVFRRRDLNARVLKDGSLDQSVERKLGILDDKIDHITQMLVEQGRAGKPPELTVFEKGMLDKFLFVQYKRNQELRTPKMESEVYQETTGEELPGDVPPRIDTSVGTSASSDARTILQNEYADSLLLDDPQVANILGEKGLVICRVPCGEALVVGTAAVVHAGTGTGAGRLHESHRGLAFPLASDILLYVGKSRDVREVHDLITKKVNEINMRIAGHCHGITGKSEKLVRSLIPSRYP